MAHERFPILEGKRALIDDIIKKDRQAFATWRSTMTETRLDLPEEVIRSLIPARIFELADNPANIGIETREKTEKSLRFSVVEIEQAHTQNGVNLLNPRRHKFTVGLQKIDDILYVAGYSDEKKHRGKGVATAFHAGLRSFAKDTGFQYIIGKNSDKNRTFFTEKLGRKPGGALPLHLQKELSALCGGMATLRHCTVTVLHEEDLNPPKEIFRKS